MEGGAPPHEDTGMGVTVARRLKLAVSRGGTIKGNGAPGKHLVGLD